MEYFDGLLNGQAQKFVSFGLRGTLNVRKGNKKCRPIVSEVSFFVDNHVAEFPPPFTGLGGSTPLPHPLSLGPLVNRKSNAFL